MDVPGRCPGLRWFAPSGRRVRPQRDDRLKGCSKTFIRVKGAVDHSPRQRPDLLGEQRANTHSHRCHGRGLSQSRQHPVSLGKRGASAHSHRCHGRGLSHSRQHPVSLGKRGAKYTQSSAPWARSIVAQGNALGLLDAIGQSRLRALKGRSNSKYDRAVGDVYAGNISA